MRKRLPGWLADAALILYFVFSPLPGRLDGDPVA